MTAGQKKVLLVEHDRFLRRVCERACGGGVTVAGIVSVVSFAVMLTRIDALFGGRAYAAYGGIYIAASLGWLWLVEK